MSINKKFGRFPDAGRRSYYNTLPNYRDGQFQNSVFTPALAEGTGMTRVLVDFLSRYPDTTPGMAIPSVMTDLKGLEKDENVLVWFGHSSYFIQLDGYRFLVDPVFSGNASPLPGSVKAFAGSNRYGAGDMPEIDALLISHDHWDHLDYTTIMQLREKADKVICGLGVGQHFEYWDWDKTKLIEKNWYDTVDLRDGFSITLTPARHFSGRTFTRNISLWTSFVLQTPSKRLFLGGDSGYGPHFKDIGTQFGPFDLAILECGQYNRKWPYIHSFPEEVITEAIELGVKSFMPVHHSKFRLAQHPWYEPLEKVSGLAEDKGLSAITPMIGEKVDMDNLEKTWDKWWRK